MNFNNTPQRDKVNSFVIPLKQGTQTYTILHLDDDKDYLNVIKTILERSTNIKVDSVNSPLKAIEMVFDGYYDIIITDLKMPGMTGYEFIESIRIVDEDIPIIILSSDINPVKIEPYTKILALSKQSDPSLLYDQIKRLIYMFRSGITNKTRIEELKIFNRKKREAVLNSFMDDLNIHDIRNQLNIQENLLSLLIEQYHEIPNHIEYLTKILHTSEQIHSIIESAYQMQNWESGSQWKNIADLFQLASTRAEQEGISASVDDHEIEILDNLYYDRIFSILVENSIMHGEKVTEISLTGKQLDSELLLIYEDNGNGISIAEKDNIFIKGYGSNTGQGLFLIRGLLALTDSTIQETGKPGKGVRFEIRIPANQFRFVENNL